MMIKQLDRWHATRLGLLVFGLAELLVAYGFLSLSIDRGNLWWYLFTLVFLVGGLQNLFKLIGATQSHGKRKSRRAGQN